MQRRLFAFALTFAGATAALSACEGFKEAMSAHQDVVARVGTQELTVQRLAEMIGNSRIPISPDVAKAIADIWVDYQLLGLAAARNDSLKDASVVNQAIWPMMSQARAEKWHETIERTFARDSGNGEAKYAQGELLSAQHILIPFPQGGQGLRQATQDSIRRVAEGIRAQVNGSNFGDIAKQRSVDPGSKDNGGYYYAFPRHMMVPEFENALLALKPGEIAPGLVQTQYGFHIIRRPMYSEVKIHFDSAASNAGTQTADSIYMDKLEKGGNIKFVGDSVAVIKKVAKDVSDFRKDNTVIATSRAGNFTAARLAQWLDAYPEQQRDQIRQGIATRPDSEVVMFVRKRFVVGDLVLKQADSMGVKVDPKDSLQFAEQFRGAVTMSWNQLGITPTLLNDSAKTQGDRQRVAATQIDTYLDKLLANQAPYVPVPGSLEAALRDRFDWKVNSAGVARAVERATRVRAAADSVRQAQQPPSQVPMPQGPMPQPRPPQGPPQGRPTPEAPARPAAPPATKQP